METIIKQWGMKVVLESTINYLKKLFGKEEYELKLIENLEKTLSDYNKRYDEQ